MPYEDGEEVEVYKTDNYKINMVEWSMVGQCVTCAPVNKFKLYYHNFKQGEMVITIEGARNHHLGREMAKDIGDLFSGDL